MFQTTNQYIMYIMVPNLDTQMSSALYIMYKQRQLCVVFAASGLSFHGLFTYPKSDVTGIWIAHSPHLIPGTSGWLPALWQQLSDRWHRPASSLSRRQWIHKWIQVMFMPPGDETSPKNHGLGDEIRYLETNEGGVWVMGWWDDFSFVQF